MRLSSTAFAIDLIVSSILLSAFGTRSTDSPASSLKKNGASGQGQSSTST
jgi:hypothetical protein